MIVAMQDSASEDQIQLVIDQLVQMGFEVHRSTGALKTVLGGVGARSDFDTREVEMLPGVQEVHRITSPYRLAGRNFRPEGTVVKFANGIEIGGKKIVVMAGPCSVESREQLFTVTELIAKAGARVVNTREPQLTGNGAFYISGEIPRLTKYEVGLPGHLRRSDDGQSWEPDPLLMDERFLAVNVKDKGLVVFSACSHAGIVNVMRHARETFPGVKLYAAMGGFHLAGPTEAAIPDTVRDLAEFGLDLIIPAHCTGWRALNALERAFGEKVVVPSAVGKRFGL